MTYILCFAWASAHAPHRMTATRTWQACPGSGWRAAWPLPQQRHLGLDVPVRRPPAPGFTRFVHCCIQHVMCMTTREAHCTYWWACKACSKCGGTAEHWGLDLLDQVSAPGFPAACAGARLQLAHRQKRGSRHARRAAPQLTHVCCSGRVRAPFPLAGRARRRGHRRFVPFGSARRRRHQDDFVRARVQRRSWRGALRALCCPRGCLGAWRTRRARRSCWRFGRSGGSWQPCDADAPRQACA